MKRTLLWIPVFLCAVCLSCFAAGETSGFTYEIVTDQAAGHDGAVITGGPEDRDLVIPAVIDGYPVTGIGNGAFDGCAGIAAVLLPEGLLSIGDNAFRNCTALADVVLPSTLESVGTCAFANIAAKYPSLPDSAAGSSSLLWYCTDIREERTGWYQYAMLEDGSAAITKILFWQAGKGIVIPSEVNGLPVAVVGGIDGPVLEAEDSFPSLTLPEGLQAVAKGAFSGIGIKKLVLPSTLRRIEDEAFCACGIQSAVLPDSLEIIGKNAFYGHWMKEITVPESIRKIGSLAFCSEDNSCPSKVTFRALDAALGSGVFGGSFLSDDRSGPENITDCYADEGAKPPHSLALSCYAGSTADLLYRYNVKKTYLKFGRDTVVTAPSGPLLEADAFSEEEIVSELTVPEGVEEIADGALTGLKYLTKVILPSTLKRIGAHAFEGCGALSRIDFAKKSSLVSIGDSAFEGTALESLRLPDTLESVGDRAFARCGSLKVLTFTKNSLLADIGGDLLLDHGKDLTVICGSGTVLAQYLDETYPEIPHKAK